VNGESHIDCLMLTFVPLPSIDKYLPGHYIVIGVTMQQFE